MEVMTLLFRSNVYVTQFSTWSKMRVSTLPSAGGLDVEELSSKLATIPVLKEEEEGEESKADEEDGAQILDEVALSDSSSTAALFGSETGWEGGEGGGEGGRYVVGEKEGRYVVGERGTLTIFVCADRGVGGGSVFDSFAPSSRSSKRVSNVGEY